MMTSLYSAISPATFTQPGSLPVLELGKEKGTGAIDSREFIIEKGENTSMVEIQHNLRFTPEYSYLELRYDEFNCVHPVVMNFWLCSPLCVLCFLWLLPHLLQDNFYSSPCFPQLTCVSYLGIMRHLCIWLIYSDPAFYCWILILLDSLWPNLMCTVFWEYRIFPGEGDLFGGSSVLRILKSFPALIPQHGSIRTCAI